MLADAIYEILHKDGPFQPFRIHLSSGAVVEIPHTDFAFFPWHRRYLLLETGTKQLRINIDQITHLEEITAPSEPEIGSETGKRN